MPPAPSTVWSALCSGHLISSPVVCLAPAASAKNLVSKRGSVEEPGGLWVEAVGELLCCLAGTAPELTGTAGALLAERQEVGKLGSSCERLGHPRSCFP